MAVLKIKDENNNWASITTIQGEAGPQGPKGETGAQGPKGDTGPAGTYTPGAGISITNDEISINLEYLTNSDILAIWNN